MYSSNKHSRKEIKISGTKSIIEKELRQFKCINRHCKHETGLTNVTKLACYYYEVKYNRDKKVCTNCLRKCKMYYKGLESKWLSRECSMELVIPNYLTRYGNVEPLDKKEELRQSTSGSISNNVNETLVKSSVKELFEVNRTRINYQVSLCNKYIVNVLPKSVCRKSDSINYLHV